MAYKDLREWIDKVEAFGELRRIEGADWDLEIGGLAEIVGRRPQSPALLFDKIKGYAPGYRLLANPLYTTNQLCLATGIEPQKDKIALVKAWRRRFSNIKLTPPKVVPSGPVQENIHTGDDIDMFEFPAPKWYELDGGRFIGTADVLITRDPEQGWVNLGVSRGQIQSKHTVGFAIVPDRHASMHRAKYFAKKQFFPVALVYGCDPLLFLLASLSFPYGVSEYDVAGGIKGEPVEVIVGEVTGLPLPASAEIVIEGEVKYNGTQVPEGPFGEWPGYYAGGVRDRPVVEVKRVLHRNSPILLGRHHIRPPSATALVSGVARSAGIWEQMEAAGVPDIRGVWRHEAGGGCFLTVVSIKQRYPGHSKQAGLIAANCAEGLRNGKYIVVVDDDIDPSNLGDVVWAITTRTDPERSIDIVKRMYGSQADPGLSKPQRDIWLASRAIIDACRPFEWISDFSPVAELSREQRESLEAKWGHLLD